jgi:transposase
MIKLDFSPEIIEQLRYEKRHHPHPYIRKKMEALFLKSQGYSHNDILLIVGIGGRATLARYFREYQEGGLARVRQLNFRKPESPLAPHRDEIEKAIAENPPATIKEARELIDKAIGIRLSLPAVHKFLKKNIGLTRYKTGSIPAAQIDPDHHKKQKDFLEQQVEPHLKEAETGERKVFFVDAAHFVWAPFLGFLWYWFRPFIPAPSGRKRFNVLGAIDAITHQIFTITNHEYINAESVCELLKAIASAEFNVPITLVLDNARYQHAKIVKELAEELGIELLYLPSYSPNLNLIERLWKFIRKQSLNSKYFESYDLFHTAISSCLSDIGAGLHASELKTFLGLKFQLFNNVSLVR